MNYKALYQQEEPGNGAQKNSTILWIQLRWRKRCDLLWPFSLINHRGQRKSIAIILFPLWPITACSSFKLTFCQAEE